MQNVVFRWACKRLINITTLILLLGGLDQVKTLNNQCLSTNMYSEQWKSLNLDELHRFNMSSETPVFKHNRKAQPEID